MELNNQDVYNKLKELDAHYIKEARQKLAVDLEVELDYLSRLIEKRGGITPKLGKRIYYLWIIKLGKVGVEVPKPELIPPEEEFEGVKKCSYFMYIDEIYGKKDKYKTPNQKDFLTEDIPESNYDGALTRVRKEINDIINDFFKDELHIVPNDAISSDYIYGADCPKSRTYELELINDETGTLQYALKYYKGTAYPFGRLPSDRIVTVLKREGAWEK